MSNDVSVRGDVAIIGMACMFPSAPNLQTYWQNIVSKVDAITDPPEEWEAELVYDPDSHANDRIYCKRGGYLGELARFNPMEYGVMPSSVDGGEPDHFLALRVAYEALADAGYLDRPFNRERAEVVIGRGTYINRGYTTLVQHGLIVDQTLRILKQLHPEHTDEELQAIKQQLKASLPPFNAETAPGLVPNIVSGRIANRLDLMGPNYTVDAACASALIAVEIGIRDLLTGKCDLAVVGGVHASTPAPIHMIFCQLNALSRRSQIRPFDKDADGTIMGEGLGMVILKRREDAERDGDRIYALIKGVGTASDGRALGLLAPRLDGEVLALQRAYDVTGISPRTIGLIEAHGTATPVGDATEIQALTRVFGPRDGAQPWCALGSVKSMIGHTLPAAGIAGLIKIALALYHKVLPPSLNCDEPNPRFELEKTPFYINTETRPWIHGAIDTPRRAGVNAFGFGGINAHAILEEYTGNEEAKAVSFHRDWDSEVLILAGDSRESLIERGQQLQQYLSADPKVSLKDLAYTLNVGGSRLNVEGTRHLTLVVSSPQDLKQKLDRALERLADPACHKIKEVSGIYFFEEPLGRQGELAFLFPGEGSQYVNMLADLCIHFPEVRASFDLIDRAFMNHTRNYLPSQLIFPPPTSKTEAERAMDEQRLWQMDGGAEAVFTASQALLALLNRLEIRPQAVVGHSTGEYSAFLASGTIEVENEAQLIDHILDLNGIYERLAAQGRIPQAMLITVSGDRSLVRSVVEQSNGSLHIAMDNCPHQIILCGTEQAATAAIERLQREGALCNVLPFNRAYHTSLFEPVSDAIRSFFQRLKIVPPKIMVYSCVTAQLYPPNPDEIRDLAVAQWARRVRFRETIEAMHDAGVRIFVEVGPKNNLTAFVDDILRGKPYLAIASNVPHRSGITQLNHLVALLAAHGVPMRLEHLYSRRAPQRLSLDAAVDLAKRHKDGARSMRLALGLQPLRLSPSIVDRRAPTADGRVQTGEAPATTVSRQPSRVIPAATTATHASAVAPAAAAGGQPSAVAPAAVGIQSPVVVSSSRPQVMQAYLQTMERFLETQQEIMQVFLLGNGHVALPSPTRAPAMGDERLPSKAQYSMVSDEGGPPLAEPTNVGSAPAEPVAAASAFTAEAASPASPAAIAQTLLALVSDKTGYPVEILGLTLNLEADLGIDSIKRVEILGAFQQKTGLLRPEDMEQVSSLKTLQQIIEFLQGSKRDAAIRNGDEVPVSSRPRTSTSPLPLPFIGTVVSLTPGQELVALREIDLEEDIFLQHHTLGGRVSVYDDRLLALPVMPLTMSMEIMAEAGAMLLPDRLLIGMQDIRAYRWMAFDEGRLALRIVARREAPDKVRVEVREADRSAAEGLVGAPIIEATMVFGDAYPEPPAVVKFSLRGERPSRWTPERLYSEGMFHGPSFQGVASVDRWGEDGAEATLRALPADRLFRSTSHPSFITDAVLLDAAGQLVGYWIAEHLETGFNVFPYRVEALHLYASRLEPPGRAKCQARIALVGDKQVRSDIDVLGPDGRLRMRLVGWEDRRFDLPRPFYRLRTSPREAILSTPWPAPVARFPVTEDFVCYRLGGFPDDFFETSQMIWRRVLAHLVLSRQEREVWRNLTGPEKRRTEWLLGRAVAKDAVRVFLKHRYGMELCPADVAIVADEHGQPVVQGPWTSEIGNLPVVSLAHSSGVAVALAGDGRNGARVGIDIEHIGRINAAVEQVAFTTEEQALLSSVPVCADDEWPLRLWCAKEAVGKALGRGMIGGPQALMVQALDVNTGIVEVILSGELARLFPQFAGRSIIAYTTREGDFIVATSLSERT